MVYLIGARKLNPSCVERDAKLTLASALLEQINISCYTEYKALGPSLIYNIDIIAGSPSVETRPKSKIPLYNPESNFGSSPAKATTKAGKFLMWLISFRKQHHQQQQQQQRRNYY